MKICHLSSSWIFTFHNVIHIFSKKSTLNTEVYIFGIGYSPLWTTFKSKVFRITKIIGIDVGLSFICSNIIYVYVQLGTFLASSSLKKVHSNFIAWPRMNPEPCSRSTFDEFINILLPFREENNHRLSQKSITCLFIFRKV